MSSIPSSKMPHAKVHEEDDAPANGKAAADKVEAAKAAAGDWIDDAADAAKAGLKTAGDTVKSHPKTSIAVGAAVLAGIAAAVAAPAIIAKNAETKKPAAKGKKTSAKKSA